VSSISWMEGLSIASRAGVVYDVKIEISVVLQRMWS